MSAGCKPRTHRKVGAQPERHDKLRHDRDIEGTPRVSGSLKPTRVGQRYRDEKARYGQIGEQLTSQFVGHALVEGKDREQCAGKEHKRQSDQARDPQADSGRHLGRLSASVWMPGSEVLARDGGGRAHQPDRRPGDQGKQLGISNCVRRLRLGAVIQRPDEPKQKHTGQVHDDPLEAGWQPEPEQLPDNGPIGRKGHRSREADHQPPREQQHHEGHGCQPAGYRGAQGRAMRAVGRNWTESSDKHDIQDDVEAGHHQTETQRRPRVAGRPERAAHHEEDQHPDAEHEHGADVGQGLDLHLRRRVDHGEKPGREDIAKRREHADRHEHRRQEGLIDRTVDLIVVARTGEASDEHAHAGEYGGHEHDDQNKDLGTDPDGCVAGVAHVVADHRLVDDALQSTQDVLQHSGPGEHPHRLRKRTLDDGTVEGLLGWAHRACRG